MVAIKIPDKGVTLATLNLLWPVHNMFEPFSLFRRICSNFLITSNQLIRI